MPLLPGHGTTWQELARSRWTEWHDAMDAKFFSYIHPTDIVIPDRFSDAARQAEEHAGAKRDVEEVDAVERAVVPRLLNRLFEQGNARLVP